MHDSDRHDLSQQLRREMTTDSTQRLPGTDRDVTVVVTAAILAADSDDLLADARRMATSTSDRHFVAIASAHVAGDHDQVDALVRDHLLDHPPRPVLEWIAAHSRSASATTGEPDNA